MSTALSSHLSEKATFSLPHTCILLVAHLTRSECLRKEKKYIILTLLCVAPLRHPAVLLPQAKAMEAAAAQAKGRARGREAALATGLETSIWDALPAFASEAEDVPTAFPAIAKELGTTLSTRPELRAPIISALHRLLGTAVEGEDGPAFPPAEDERLAAARAAVVAFARNFLPILFNIFVAAPPEGRTAVAGAVAAFSSATDPAALGTFFRTVMKKYIKVTSDQEGAPDALLEGGSTRSARRATFMDLMLAMAPGLDDAGVVVVVEKARRNNTIRAAGGSIRAACVLRDPPAAVVSH